MIELGLHTDNWRTLSGSFETACDAAVKFGLKHIEFAVIHGQYFITAMGYDPSVSLQSNPRALRRYLDGKGLKVSQIDGSYPLMGPDGSSYGVQYVQQSIRFAAEIDCPMVDTVDGALEIEGLSRDEVFRITCDNYRQVLPWAEDYGVIINVEPHGPYTTDVDFMRRLFETFDSEYLRLNMDTGNTFIAGLNPVQYMRDLLPYLSHMHIKDVSQSLADALRGEETGIACSEVPIGGGVNAGNITQCIELLKETGWSGAVSIECNGADRNIRDSVEFMRAVLDRETKFVSR
jgi:sugar phosphate isomerase/epimerase